MKTSVYIKLTFSVLPLLFSYFVLIAMLNLGINEHCNKRWNDTRLRLILFGKLYNRTECNLLDNQMHDGYTYCIFCFNPRMELTWNKGAKSRYISTSEPFKTKKHDSKLCTGGPQYSSISWHIIYQFCYLYLIPLFTHIHHRFLCPLAQCHLPPASRISLSTTRQRQSTGNTPSYRFTHQFCAAFVSH
jgi:hypothetical protein